jgi:hypothetical protein
MNFGKVSHKIPYFCVFGAKFFSKITYKGYFHAIFENFSTKNAKVRSFFGSSSIRIVRNQFSNAKYANFVLYLFRIILEPEVQF